MSKKGFVVISALLTIGGIVFMNSKRIKDSFEPLYSPKDHPILKDAVNTADKQKTKKRSESENAPDWIKKRINKVRKTVGAILGETDREDEADTKKKENVLQATETEPEHEDTCTDELLRDGNNLGGIINKTDAVLKGKVSKDEKINCAILCKFWCEIFEEESCKKLFAEYNSIAEKCGIAFEDVSEEAAEELLTKWMEFFEELGVRAYEDKSADEDGNVVVTGDNRMFYKNGKKFPDGTVCKVINMPWMFKGDIYYRGTLEEIERSDAPQEPVTDEAQSENVEPIAEEEQQKEIKEDE